MSTPRVLVRPALRLVCGVNNGVDQAVRTWARSWGVPCESVDPGQIQDASWKVQVSGGTVVISLTHELDDPSRRALEWAAEFGRPALHLCREGTFVSPARLLLSFTEEHGIVCLHLTGPDAGDEPEITAFTQRVLEEAFTRRDPGDTGYIVV